MPEWVYGLALCWLAWVVVKLVFSALGALGDWRNRKNGGDRA